MIPLLLSAYALTPEAALRDIEWPSNVFIQATHATPNLPNSTQNGMLSLIHI